MSQNNGQRARGAMPRRATGRLQPAIAVLLLMPTVLALPSGCRGPSSSDPGSDAGDFTAQQADPAVAGAAAPLHVEEALSEFSAARSWRHLEALVGIGPRPAGSAASAQARAYLRAALEAAGYDVREQQIAVGKTPPAASNLPAPAALPQLTHVIAHLQGSAPDGLMIATPYSTARAPAGAPDARIVGANAAASGPAVALELARALASQPRVYSIWVVLIEGDADSEAPLAGSRGLAAQLASEGLLVRVRAAVFLERVGDADLQIARDLHSNRTDRELIWRTAHRLGHEDSFSSDGFETPLASHRAFLEAGLRRAVAILDSRYGGAQPPGAWLHSPEDLSSHCSRESLDTVGDVLLASLRGIEQRLARIDRFVKAPVESTAHDAYERRAASLPATAASTALVDEALAPSTTDARAPDPQGGESAAPEATRAGPGGVERSEPSDPRANAAEPPNDEAASAAPAAEPVAPSAPATRR